MKTERMKRFIIEFLLLSLLLPVLASCGQPFEGVLYEAEEYKVVRKAGRDYLVFDEETYNRYKEMPFNTGCILHPSYQQFDSPKAFKKALREGEIDCLHAVHSFRLEEDGIPLGTLDKMYVLNAPDGFENDSYNWDWDGFTHELVHRGDGFRERISATFYLDREGYEKDYQSHLQWFEGRPYEQIEDRGAIVTKRHKNGKSVLYTLKAKGKVYHVDENYYDYDAEVPDDIEVFCEQGDLFYRVIISNTVERPSEEWILSISARLAP